MRSSLVRWTATVATLAAVAGVVVATADGSAVPIDPALSAYSLGGRQPEPVTQQEHGVRASARAAVERAAAAGRASRATERTKQAEQAAERAASTERERAAKAAAQARAAGRTAERARATRATSRDPKGAARAMIGEYGWGAGQFGCLEALWEKESGWKVRADNPSSSAYGIPQALPGRKMASAGSDWRTNPVTQIRWGLGYIRDVYGSPCGAWQHSRAHNWY